MTWIRKTFYWYKNLFYYISCAQSSIVFVIPSGPNPNQSRTEWMTNFSHDIVELLGWGLVSERLFKGKLVESHKGRGKLARKNFTTSSQEAFPFRTSNYLVGWGLGHRFFLNSKKINFTKSSPEEFPFQPFPEASKPTFFHSSPLAVHKFSNLLRSRDPADSSLQWSWTLKAINVPVWNRRANENENYHFI